MYHYLVEFIGSLLLLFVVLYTQNPLAIGAAYALIILSTVGISGGYINPAITIVMAAAGKLSTAEIMPYCLAQIFGGLVALEIFKRLSY
jgi:aquaporin Z